MIYTVFVGHYERPEDSKKDMKVLLDKGVKGYIFSKDGKYSIKIMTTLKEEQADITAKYFNKLGLDTFVEKSIFKR